MSNIRYEYQGAKGLKEISALTGIPTPTLSARIKQLGMTVEQAVNHQKGVFFKAKQHEYQGLVGIAEIARHYGIPVGTLYYRVKGKGLSIEEALGDAVFQQPAPNKKAPVAINRVCKKHGTTKPDLLHPLWKLALGIAA
ncbi:helix-turn-helix domain-containing protein [Vibrio cholerae]|nr:hypothetical protein [Vibrio cholerae]EJL6858611.1 hypothetical protein [Vibrio cholerae]